MDFIFWGPYEGVVAAAAGNTLLVDVENACLVVQSHASFWCVLSNHEAIHRNCDKTGSYACSKYKIRNLLVKTFQLIYYMTTFLKIFFCTWWPCPTPQKGPKIWNPLPGMPRSVWRHYDEVINPVTLLWRRCTSRLGRCYMYGEVPLA